MDQLAGSAAAFGFGQFSGLGLLDQAESPGVLGSPNSTGYSYLGNRVMMAIGQGALISVTPLQLALAYGAIANGGRVYAPYLVRRIDMPDGSQMALQPPQVKSEIPWTPAQRQVILDGLCDVVGNRHGTAYKAKIDPALRVAGKHALLQRSDVGGEEFTDAWFACFAPWDNPEICVVAMLEKAKGHGGEVAAPVARDVVKEYFKLKGLRSQQLPELPRELTEGAVQGSAIAQHSPSGRAGGAPGLGAQ